MKAIQGNHACQWIYHSHGSYGKEIHRKKCFIFWLNSCLSGKHFHIVWVSRLRDASKNATKKDGGLKYSSVVSKLVSVQYLPLLSHEIIIHSWGPEVFQDQMILLNILIVQQTPRTTDKTTNLGLSTFFHLVFEINSCRTSKSMKAAGGREGFQKCSRNI